METRSKWRALVLLVVALFLSLPNVFAADGLFGALPMTEILRRIADWLYNVFQDDYIAFGVLSIMMFILLYAIFKAALTKVKVFDGQKKQANIVAFSLSMISTFSLFWYSTQNGGMRAVLEQYFSVFGLFGALIIGMVVFMIIFFGFGHESNARWKLGLVGAGIALIFGGALTNNDGMTSLGVFFLVIGLIALLFGGGKDGGSGLFNNNSNPNGNNWSPDKWREAQDDIHPKPGDPDWPGNLEPAHVQIQVTDEDDHGLGGAIVSMDNITYRKKYRGLVTNSNGVYPPYGGYYSILPGTYKVKATKTGWWNVVTFYNRQGFSNKVTVDIAPGSQEIIQVVMKRKAEKAEDFKPYIHDVKDEGEHWNFIGEIQ